MASIEKFAARKVHHYYWDLDINCASTMLNILSEIFSVDVNSQVLDAAVGMHGAGEFGAQCGLVEGSLMFLGIIGREKSMPDEAIIRICRDFAERFEHRFGSLRCSVLRPEGFKPENPPHLCEPLTRNAVLFSIDYISGILAQSRKSAADR